MTNINVEVPDEIYKKVKVEAVMSDKTVKDLIIEKIAKAIRGKAK